MDAKPSPQAAPVDPNDEPAVPQSLVTDLPARPSSKGAPTLQAFAYVTDEESETVLKRSFANIGLSDMHVVRGDIDAAIQELTRKAWPRLLVVDVAGLADPMGRVTKLADISDPATEVFVVGDRNDIVLYREMKQSGVSEYFFKPLVTGVVTRAFSVALRGAPAELAQRTGRIVVSMGVRGGVGATTLATQAAWFLAEERQRRVLMLDLDLQSGDAALQLDVSPTHALREALEHPDRLDDLFLERGVIHVTDRLGLLASLEPLSDSVPLSQEAVLQLVHSLAERYRFVIVDLPNATAIGMPKLLEMANTILLVSDGSLHSAREVSRWRERIGRNSADRTTLHVLNKAGADGSLPEPEFRRALGLPPDITIAYERDIAKAAVLGAKALHETSAMRRAMPALTRELAGSNPDSGAKATLWHRVFG